MNNKSTITTLHVTFNLPLFPRQIPQWRGAVIEAAGIEQDLLHNHRIREQSAVGSRQTAAPMVENALVKENGTAVIEAPAAEKSSNIHRYPLIHYRSRKGRASIFAIGEGVEIIRRWLLQKGARFVINGRKQDLLIKGLYENQFELRITPTPRTYRLLDYLALNETNYARWRAADRLTKRIELLDEVLTGHLLAFAEGAGWKVPERIEAHLLNLTSLRKVTMHGMERIAFNVLYRANIALPPGIALGRSVAFGFGTQMPVRNGVFR